ncbi:flagellar protein FliT [Paramixta manurensis]|uniref:Flagellar protein FliT n=1 Tax=Paramixta manurensis TaxID=2740817 RepID=A0A6M8UCU4_9GAMM|nr:flagellar protein FliT [Erwiniaceae bacterium PD-1]
MNIAPHLLATYQQLLELSQGMLRMAVAGQWDALIEIEMDYVKTVETLALSTRDTPISLHTQELLRPVLRHIIDNEKEVKQLLQQRMNELTTLIGQTSRQKNINTAYGRLAGNILFPGEV